MRGIKVAHLAKDNQLECVSGHAGMSSFITEQMISRPGIELAGFMDFFDNNRVILIGSKENSFFLLFDQKIQEVRLRQIMKLKPPAVIFSVNVDVPEVYKKLGDEYGVPILKSQLRTTALNSKLFSYLQDYLSPRKTVHGVLLDIGGLGVLITGKSGIGKSETALELIKRGHILISDDRVDIYQKDVGILIGQAPKILERYLEIRGIGIVDVISMFGVSAFRETKKIRMVVELEKWEENRYYDRLGLDLETTKYFDTEIPKIVIPVLPGRNVATLVESAARNQKLKYMGYHAAFNLTREITRSMKRNEREENESN
ncbi:MAG: HPr(Ser) kinase/phosphatase [Paracholeplasma sp.]|jgi:HPr kinase/phosphorylase|uniref:HPr kinase/phosphorylase n=1 Tax=Acholeplasma brassicae TaxID=61635 RepID=U4KQ98_9MOLU|nr:MULTISPECIES: HPr(Ser) kinase/phosphatase [Paracholeplasma]MDY3195826.1 HPr(Ser) kinase/phosphatase [Paracholeplasma sp.]CCV66615.1 HPr(Ser) kinase/phosphorylase [Paracholeplasma brassicae]HBT59574.1 HPr(Ser) kinase/phosphatase [Acholeplasmataceae bacterium]